MGITLNNIPCTSDNSIVIIRIVKVVLVVDQMSISIQIYKGLRGSYYIGQVLSLGEPRAGWFHVHASTSSSFTFLSSPGFLDQSGFFCKFHNKHTLIIAKYEYRKSTNKNYSLFLNEIIKLIKIETFIYRYS